MNRNDYSFHGYARSPDFSGRLLSAIAIFAVVFCSNIGSSLACQEPSEFGAVDEALTVISYFKMPPDSQEGRLVIEAQLGSGRHIYSQHHGGPETATRISITPSNQFQLLGDFQPDYFPLREKAEGKWKETFEEKVVWNAPFKISEGIDPSALKIDVSFLSQTCDATSCLPPEDRTLVAIYAGQLTAAELLDLEAPPKSHPADTSKNAGDWEGMTLPLVLPLAFLAGLILNVMPCVLPVIGLKVMSFVQQAGENPIRVFMLNAVFSLGMIAVFLVLATLAVFSGFGWGELYESLLFKVIMISVVFVFGLSFFSVWEIPIPGFIGDASSSKAAQKEGMVGAFLKGVLTTLLATPCSGPMLIPAVVWAIAQPPLVTYLVFFAMGVGMAFPFLVIGAVPKLAKILPRPGQWMETFKQLMGFVMMGTCVFFLGSVGTKYLFPVLSLLVFLSLSCWFIGRSEETSNLTGKLKGWAWATTIGAVGVWFSFFFLIPQFELEYLPYSKVALERHLANGETVFVDFTADW
ncbi:MAG: protein-disulfide reductase DsbD family protein [Mariniblastus sp.]